MISFTKFLNWFLNLLFYDLLYQTLYKHICVCRKYLNKLSAALHVLFIHLILSYIQAWQKCCCVCVLEHLLVINYHNSRIADSILAIELLFTNNRSRIPQQKTEMYVILISWFVWPLHRVEIDVFTFICVLFLYIHFLNSHWKFISFMRTEAECSFNSTISYISHLLATFISLLSRRQILLLESIHII